jgi:hypothetical protein
LGTIDEYKIFNLLHNSITDQQFELPEDENDAKIVLDFLETLPPIDIITPEDIMSALNKGNKHRIFAEDETSQCSGDDVDDKDYKDKAEGNATYNK